MQPRPRRPAAFTLVEMLVVVTILILLATIGAPVALKMYTQAKRAKSMTHLKVLNQAVHLYAADWKAFDPPYPPSRSALGGSIAGSGAGAQYLAVFLTGYADDPGEDGTPGPGSKPGLWDFSQDDGAGGWGFRVQSRGRVHGPYGDAERLPMMEFAAPLKGGKKPCFVDEWDSPFLYYRWEEQYSVGYNHRDNYNADDADDPLSGPASFYSYIKPASDDRKAYRDDFLLISRGPNGQWDSPGEGGSDDITNFYFSD
jgi:type II secretory pathway pseudopilin PulG